MPDPGRALPDILVAALALVRDRRVLMVTARARDVLYMPGGKIDPGETAAEAAVRESLEEVAVRVSPTSVRELFTVVTQAHGEPDGRLVRMAVFAGETDDEPRPSSEIDAIHWVDSAAADRCPPAGRAVLARLVALELID
ncbi:NUDIX hydrolase [Labedella endophytica]|uniref:NUDIX domain-containing protein n=1 Tax=Labedella endophytica TaxID=1523160 RepID=A0A433JV20_9MICO|nr:NUDIX domain-containing protein [Labedella endophytica]RUR01953.1 NUDIX domain-containing protein [Labedella endophytica]